MFLRKAISDPCSLGKSVSHENNWKERLADRRNSACKGPEVKTKLKNC